MSEHETQRRGEADMTEARMIRRARDHHDRAAAVSVFADAFVDDPVHRWVLPDPQRRRDQLVPWFDLLIRQAAPGSHVDQLDGAAGLWQPPKPAPVDSDEDGTDDDAHGDDGASDLVSYLIDQLGEAEALAKLVELAKILEVHPAEPHWYLGVLGTEPERQGQGLGAALLDHHLRQSDAEGVPAYLESSNPRNVPLYERHGFVVTGEILLGEEEIVMATMWREPGGTA